MDRTGAIGNHDYWFEMQSPVKVARRMLVAWAVATGGLGCGPGTINSSGDDPAPQATPRGGAPGVGGGAGGRSGGGASGASPTPVRDAGPGGGAGATGAGGAGAAATDARPGDAAGPATPVAPVALAITFSPATHTFTDSIELKLATDDPRARIFYTLDDKPPTEMSVAYGGAIPISASTVVRAFAVAGDQKGPVANHSYLKLAKDAADFTSANPIVLLHSRVARPLKKVDGTKPGTISVFTPDPKTGRASMTAVPALNMRMGFHVRGSSSEGWEKKSYKVELWDGAADEDFGVPVLGMPKDADWVFFGPFSYDRAMVRNSLMYAVSNQIGRWAPRTRFAEVFLTDVGKTVSYADYVGVYVIIEKIEADKDRLPVKKLLPTDIQPPEVTGSYIFKIDRLNSGEKGINAGFGPGRIWAGACPVGVRGGCGIGGFQSIGTLSYYEPDEVTILKAPAQVKYLADTLNAFANALAAKQDFSALIDAPGWIDYHVLNTFTKNMDAHRLSAYFYKDRGGKLVAGPVWDFDRTLGCTTDFRCPDPTWWDATNLTDDGSATFNYGWWRPLFDDPGFKTAYFARMKQLLQKELSVANLHGLVDMLLADLGSESPARNFVRWRADAPVGGHAVEIKRLKDWISGRVRWLEGCVALPDPETCRGGGV